MSKLTDDERRELLAFFGKRLFGGAGESLLTRVLEAAGVDLCAVLEQARKADREDRLAVARYKKEQAEAELAELEGEA